MRSRTTVLYFPRLDNGTYAEVDSTHSTRLEYYVGAFIALALCKDDNDLEMIRIRRIGIGETVIVHKLPNHIKLSIV